MIPPLWMKPSRPANRHRREAAAREGGNPKLGSMRMMLRERPSLLTEAEEEVGGDREVVHGWGRWLLIQPEQSPAQKTMSPSSSSVERGTGRPRGRPRVRPLATDRDDSGNAEDESVETKDQVEESSALKKGRPQNKPLSSSAEGDHGDEEQGDTQETEAVEEDSVNAGEEDDHQMKTDVEKTDGVPIKRGRGRPRTKPLTNKNQTTNTENSEDGSEPAKTKENEGTGRKRGRPRSKPLSSEAPESSIQQRTVEMKLLEKQTKTLRSTLKKTHLKVQKSQSQILPRRSAPATEREAWVESSKKAELLMRRKKMM